MIREKKIDDILTIQKYSISKIGISVMGIAAVILLICYTTVLYIIELNAISEETAVAFSIIRDILLVSLSIIGTSLLTTVFIEKNRKNVDYTELIANDIFASPEFYSNLTEENKKKMNKYLEEHLYRRSPIKNEIYTQFRERIYLTDKNYYYDNFSLNVSYFQCEKYSEKIIKRFVKIRAYEEGSVEHNLFLFSYKLSPSKEIKNFEVISVKVDGKDLKIGKDVVIDKDTTRDSLFEKSGYTDNYNVYLRTPITLHTNTDTILNIEYISRVADGDMSVGFGVFVPCKEFNLDFTAPSGMTVYAHPYSFFNTENYHPNSLYKNNISIHYSDWLLPGEGVAICVSESRTAKTLQSPHKEQPLLEATN